MSNRTERQTIINDGGATRRHSLSDRNLKRVRDREKKSFGSAKDKAAKSERSRRREEQFLREFPEMQFNRALGQMFNGTATEENIKHVFDNAHKYEQEIERYETEKESTVTITIVDFLHPTLKNLS